MKPDLLKSALIQPRIDRPKFVVDLPPTNSSRINNYELRANPPKKKRNAKEELWMDNERKKEAVRKYTQIWELLKLALPWLHAPCGSATRAPPLEFCANAPVRFLLQVR